MRITARIQFAGILNLCEASATKAVKGRAEGGLALPGIEAGLAYAEPSNGAPEHKKTHAAHITKSKDGERAGGDSRRSWPITQRAGLAADERRWSAEPPRKIRLS